ncbi:hypothetical protein QJS66_09845 [Kocuria rhizophila]|nr:hypothetical protein QJS66_09845 [Kocuria rhizophila]
MEHPRHGFATRAEALTWAEDRILEQFGTPTGTPDNVHSTRSELLSTLAEDDAPPVPLPHQAGAVDAGTTLLRTGQLQRRVHGDLLAAWRLAPLSPGDPRRGAQAIGRHELRPDRRH